MLMSLNLNAKPNEAKRIFSVQNTKLFRCKENGLKGLFVLVCL